MSIELVLPILIPFLTAILTLIVRGNRDLQRAISVIGAGTLLVASIVLLLTVNSDGIISAQMGGWQAPFGITLVADLFSAIMVFLAGLMALAVALFALVSMDPRRESFGYHPLYHILLMGICGAFLTGDIFNLYVWFEVMLIASFVLLVLGGERAQLEGAIKYVTLNLISSMIFLTAVGILYGVTGTLNMADLGQKFAEADSPGLATTLSMMFLVTFGIKAAVFPAFFWLPASYHTPPIAISAIFAGLLTKVGVYALVRVFTLIFVQDTDYTHTIILIIASFSMVVGVLGSIAQHDLRRMISFLIVSQVGFMLIGLGFYTPLALAGLIFYIIHHIIAETNLFLISGIAYRLRGSYELHRLGGLYQSYPLLAALFFVAALALAGLPPFSGFFGKLILARAGLEVEGYIVVGIALAVSLLTLFPLSRIWSEVFLKPLPDEVAAENPELTKTVSFRTPAMLTMLAPVVVLAILSTLIGLGGEAVYTLAYDAAEQLMEPTQYIEAVLGESS